MRNPKTRDEIRRRLKETTREELESTNTTKAGDEGLQGVDEGVNGLGEAVEGGALLGLLHERLEGGCDLLEGCRSKQIISFQGIINHIAERGTHTRDDSTKGTTEAGLTALHHLVELAEDVVDDRCNSWLKGTRGGMVSVA